MKFNFSCSRNIISASAPLKHVAEVHPSLIAVTDIENLAEAILLKVFDGFDSRFLNPTIIQ